VNRDPLLVQQVSRRRECFQGKCADVSKYAWFGKLIHPLLKLNLIFYLAVHEHLSVCVGHDSEVGIQVPDVRRGGRVSAFVPRQ
jgi:hypothetical protein